MLRTRWRGNTSWLGLLLQQAAAATRLGLPARRTTGRSRADRDRGRRGRRRRPSVGAEAGCRAAAQGKGRSADCWRLREVHLPAPRAMGAAVQTCALLVRAAFARDVRPPVVAQHDPGQARRLALGYVLSWACPHTRGASRYHSGIASGSPVLHGARHPLFDCNHEIHQGRVGTKRHASRCADWFGVHHIARR